MKEKEACSADASPTSFEDGSVLVELGGHEWNGAMPFTISGRD
jgi:hypothetical protein